MKNSLSYPKYWAERLEPLKGESISSWMIRIALANLTSLSSLLSDIPIKNERNIQIQKNRTYYRIHIDLDFKWIPEIIQLFIEKIGISKRKLREISLYKLTKEIKTLTKNKYSDRSYTIFNSLWTTRWITTHSTGLRYCPICLKEDEIPYFRKI